MPQKYSGTMLNEHPIVFSKGIFALTQKEKVGKKRKTLEENKHFLSQELFR